MLPRYFAVAPAACRACLYVPKAARSAAWSTAVVMVKGCTISALSSNVCRLLSLGCARKACTATRTCTGSQGWSATTDTTRSAQTGSAAFHSKQAAQSGHALPPSTQAGGRAACCRLNNRCAGASTQPALCGGTELQRKQAHLQLLQGGSLKAAAQPGALLQLLLPPYRRCAPARHPCVRTFDMQLRGARDTGSPELPACRALLQLSGGSWDCRRAHVSPNSAADSRAAGACRAAT